MAKTTFRVEGVEEVLRNLNAEITGIENRTMGGLMAAGLIIQRESQRRTPVDEGNLKGSAYTRRSQFGGLEVEVGYTADYAVPVHEILDARHPVGEAKFLENAIKDKAGEVVEAIRQRAKVE